MRRGFVLLIGLALIAGFVACESHQKSDRSSDWNSSMQGLSKEVREILPFIYSRKAYSDPNNRVSIEQSLKNFAGKAHSITPEMGKSYFGDDPLVNYSLENMSEDVKRALEAYQLGQLEYSRSVAKSVVNHCFRCHSVANAGGVAVWEIKGIENLNLSALERVDLLIAGRRYQEAITRLEALLGDSDYLQQTPFDYESALRKYIAVVVRVEQDPKRALSKIDEVLARPGLPFYIQEQTQAWRNSLAAWVKEKSKKPGNYLNSAKERIAKGKKLQQFARDHAGDVEFLRATGLLHEYLKSSKAKPKDLASAYYLLGESYEILDELGYWNLHEVYYESCIRKAPKGPLAQACFGRLEASVMLGYSGSSGVHVPSQEKLRLEKIKSLLR